VQLKKRISNSKQYSEYICLFKEFELGEGLGSLWSISFLPLVRARGPLGHKYPLGPPEGAFGPLYFLIES